MYRDGSMVTLVNAKEHFDGQDTLKLGSGVCGMIVQSRKKTQGEPEYVVDFGAYGRWNCLHGELNGDDPEGWDKPQRVSSTEEGMAILMDYSVHSITTVYHLLRCGILLELLEHFHQDLQ